MVDVALKLYYHPQPSKPEWRLGAKPVALPSRVWIRLLEVGLTNRRKQQLQFPAHLDVVLDIGPLALGELDLAPLR